MGFYQLLPYGSLYFEKADPLIPMTWSNSWIEVWCHSAIYSGVKEVNLAALNVISPMAGLPLLNLLIVTAQAREFANLPLLS